MSGFLLIPLIAIIYEDFKYRAIHWWWLITISVMSFFLKDVYLNVVILNLSFICIQLLGVTLYFSIKHGRFINLTNSFIGIGDILFFLSISFCLNPLEFIHFHIYSMIFALIGYTILKKIIEPKYTTIPLAGWMSIFLSICVIIDWLLDYKILEKWRLI
jgi:hypothetical protein